MSLLGGKGGKFNVSVKFFLRGRSNQGFPPFPPLPNPGYVKVGERRGRGEGETPHV